MILFLKKEAHLVQHPHDDALVVTTMIAHLKPFDVLLIGFTKPSILPLEMIDLPLYLREAPTQAIQSTTFMVIDQPSAYNIIIGKSMVNTFCVVLSNCHMAMRFTPIRVRAVKGEQMTLDDAT